MTPLEQRYRKLLRRLPASYRRRWADDMVATFLAATVPDDPEEAEYVEQCGRPSREERLSILRLAVRLRLGGVDAAPRAFAWGEAVRHVALGGFLVNFGMAMVAVWHSLWVTGSLAGSPVPADLQGNSAGLSPADLLLLATGLLWGGALWSVVRGSRTWALSLGTLAWVPTLVGSLSASGAAVTTGVPAFVVTSWSEAVLMFVPLLSLAAFHADAPPVDNAHRWASATAAAALLAPIVAYAMLGQVGGPLVLDRPGVWAGIALCATLLHLATRGTRDQRDRSAPSWPLALALMSAAVLAHRLVSLLDYAVLAGGAEIGTLLIVATVQAAGLVVVTAVLARRAGRGLGRLSPEVPPAPTAA